MADGQTRRRFLARAGGVAAGAVAVGAGVPGVARAAATAKRVAVLGGGVSGLSAAHELAERGYAVTVYEYHTALGGKARSMDVPGTGGGGRRALPGEHGFRFVPGFYRNLPDTLRRIPFPGNPGGVHDNLRSGTETLFARAGGRADLHFPLRRVTTPPRVGDLTPAWIRDQVLSVLGLVTRMPAHEAAYFADRVLVHLTSCDARREGQWEKVPWWDFIRAEDMSEEYRRFFGIGQTRNLVATRAEEASTRTVARVIIEALLLWGLLGRGQDGDADIDRVLNAPTSEAWIDPWEVHLRSLGVEFAIISEWDRPGILYGRPARQCTREEIVAETWAQLKDAVGTAGDHVLDDADLLSWFMDPAVTGLGGPDPRNREQLLIHPAGTLYDRPSAATAVPNFFLAGDYVRTDVDLATMEGANESARRAVNALLDADGSGADRCRVHTLYRPPEMEPLKRVDELRYRLGLPNTFDLG
ncbi:hydroxysqualene dehydroxylase [Streptomyces sp. NPDC001070]